MPRPRTLDAHPREFFTFTEELLTQPSRSVQCEGPGPRQAFALRAGMYHFWSRLRREVEACGFRPPDLDRLAEGLKAAGKLPDSADGALLRAMFRIAANTSISIDGKNIVHFVPKSETALGALLSKNINTQPALAPDGGAGLLAELEHSSANTIPYSAAKTKGTI